MLTEKEINRYSRHLLLNEIGAEGQEKLKKASVLVVGAGGLSAPVLLYLAAAGVGTLGIIDFDHVDESNLQRQVIFTEKDMGMNKAAAAAERLKQANPLLDYIVYQEPLSSENAVEIISYDDVVVDGSDNFSTRYLVNDACILCDKPLVFGSIFKFEGQVTVFNYQGSASYRCLFPESPEEGEVPNCSEVGVLGVLPGITGTLQANEALKIILGIGEVLHNTLLVFDALQASFHKFKFNKNPANFNVDKIEQYIFDCSSVAGIPVKEIEASVLLYWIQKGELLQIIDVRSREEFETGNLNGINIPIASLQDQIDQVLNDRKIIVYCQSGSRSKKACELLLNKGFDNVISLKGGLNEYKKNVLVP